MNDAVPAQSFSLQHIYEDSKGPNLYMSFASISTLIVFLGVILVSPCY